MLVNMVVAEGVSHIKVKSKYKALVCAYRYLRSSLARHAVPDDIVFVAAIPHNATGKVRCV